MENANEIEMNREKCWGFVAAAAMDLHGLQYAREEEEEEVENY